MNNCERLAISTGRSAKPLSMRVLCLMRATQQGWIRLSTAHDPVAAICSWQADGPARAGRQRRSRSSGRRACPSGGVIAWVHGQVRVMATRRLQATRPASAGSKPASPATAGHDEYSQASVQLVPGKGIASGAVPPIGAAMWEGPAGPERGERANKASHSASPASQDVDAACGVQPVWRGSGARRPGAWLSATPGQPRCLRPGARLISRAAAAVHLGQEGCRNSAACR